MRKLRSSRVGSLSSTRAGPGYELGRAAALEHAGDRIVDRHRRITQIGAHRVDGRHQGIEIADVTDVAARAFDLGFKGVEALSVTSHHGDPIATRGKTLGALIASTRAGPGYQTNRLGRIRHIEKFLFTRALPPTGVGSDQLRDRSRCRRSQSGRGLRARCVRKGNRAPASAPPWRRIGDDIRPTRRRRRR